MSLFLNFLTDDRNDLVGFWVWYRESEIIVPFELVHLPGSGSVPSWLSNSALAPFVSDAVQLEHLLRVVACAAAQRFLLANARRHGTCLASLAACYFFRMVCCDCCVLHAGSRPVWSRR